MEFPLANGIYIQNITKVPKGTFFYSEVQYDNTADNPHNPSNPPKLVTLGEGTTDEMMLTFFIIHLTKQVTSSSA